MKENRSTFNKLNVDCAMIAKNYASIKNFVGSRVTCAATIKADAYGLGMVPIMRCLSKAGCNKFFVRTLDEAIDIRNFSITDEIYVLDNGSTVYGANCFRESFLDILYSKFERKSERPGDLPVIFQYSTYLPSLINYLDQDGAPKVTFVHKMEQFTNSCYGYFLKPENEGALPVDEFLYEGDMMGIFGGLFNIESTLTRFDTDPVDNYLIGPEIEVAFQHFK